GSNTTNRICSNQPTEMAIGYAASRVRCCPKKAAKGSTVPTIGSMSPFFIVSDVTRTIVFYVDRLGFDVGHREPEQNPFFAILQRGGAMLFVKSGDASPLPNNQRDPEMRWDAYCYTPDPDALEAEFAG